jgi:hypothetical protein
MNTLKLISITSLIKGICFVVLGIVHCVVTFMPVEELIGPMPEKMASEFRVWFFGVGAFLLFIGLTDILSYKGLKTAFHWAWNFAFISALFCTLCGLAGVIVFREGPPFFIAFAGIFQIFPLILYRQHYNH